MLVGLYSHADQSLGAGGPSAEGVSLGHLSSGHVFPKGLETEACLSGHKVLQGHLGSTPRPPLQMAPCTAQTHLKFREGGSHFFRVPVSFSP